MPDNTHRQQVVFIIRLWAEVGQSILDEWRGSIEQGPIGERCYFTSFEHLNAIIKARLRDGDRGRTPPEMRT